MGAAGIASKPPDSGNDWRATGAHGRIVDVRQRAAHNHAGRLTAAGYEAAVIEDEADPDAATVRVARESIIGADRLAAFFDDAKNDGLEVERKVVGGIEYFELS
jgi:hypothetical protein